MRIIPEIDGVTIVLIGHFNPMIFHPIWFSEQGIFSPDEVKNASIEIVHPEISVFKIEWLSVRVEKSRFIAESRMPPLIRVADFIVSTFGDNLIHTPVGHIGINRTVHFKTTLDKIDKVGKTLAPHYAWGDWGREIEGPDRAKNQPNDKHGGLRLIVMEQRNLEDRYKGHIQAKVEPSTKLLDGITVDINDHYEIENGSNVIGCKEAISIVKNNFEKSIYRSEKIIDHIMSLTQ
jgi:hypothetical protein